MDPARKRRVRLIVALTAALALAGALVYTSFSSSTEASTPSQVVKASEPGRSYELTGKVVNGSVTARGRGPALPHPRPDRIRVGSRALRGRGA